MARPSALARQLKLAEEAELAAQQSNQPVAEPSNTDTPASDTTAAAQPSADTTQPTAQDAQTVVTTTTTDATATALAAFEARLKAAEGVAKKAGEDLRDVRSENQRLQDKLQMQDDMIKVLSRVQPQPEPEQKPVVNEPKAPTVDMPSTTALDEHDRDVLDAYDGLLPVFQKMFVTKEELGQILNSAFSKLTDQFMRDIEPVRSQVSTIVKTEEQKRQERLVYDTNAYLKSGFPEGANVPDCVDIDRDPEFGAWVKTMADLSGNSYFDAYQNAVTKTFDAKIAARIQREFLLYKGLNVTVQPGTTTEPVATVTQPVRVDGLPSALDDQIALPRSSAAGESKTVTVDNVTYDQVVQASKNFRTHPTPENQKVYDDVLVRYARKREQEK